MHCNDLSLHGGEGSVQMLLLLTVAFWVRRLQLYIKCSCRVLCLGYKDDSDLVKCQLFSALKLM